MSFGRIRFGRAFDDERELRGRCLEADGFGGVGELCAIDNVAPVDKVGDGRRVEAEFLRGDGGDEFRAGFVGGIVKACGRRCRRGNGPRRRA